VTSPVRGLVLEIHRSVNRMRFGIMGIVLLKSAIPVGVTSSKGGLLVDAAIGERNGSADPEVLALGGRDLVAHPLADHLALELGKGEQHVEGEPAHAGRGVERLGDRHERDPMLIEQLDQLGL
jgi:hypothetical protein